MSVVRLIFSGFNDLTDALNDLNSESIKLSFVIHDRALTMQSTVYMFATL